MDTSQRDRQLLFGVLCVQCGLITSEQLVEAAGGWTVDRSRGLAQRLEDAALLSPEDRCRIEGVVDISVRAHDGDTSRTLSSFGGDRVVTESFGGAVTMEAPGEATVIQSDADAPTLTPSLVTDCPPTEGIVDVPGDGESDAAVTSEAAGRYVHLDTGRLFGKKERLRTVRAEDAELGRGGMGRVLLAFDHHVGRDVAIKELLPGTAGGGSSLTPRSPMVRSGQLVARFLREARVTGQLEHPSIVPVYELGRRSDGTLYYAMKLVRGRTLRQAIAESSSLPQRLMLLSHVADLCYAVAYAHSRGVINRDIKPDNIMLGEFGETLVLDWGLAKVLGKEDLRGREIVREIEQVDAAASGKTVAQFLGTPNYMPPEQASGRLDEVDERADVWSIGAVLYQTLTGLPPFTGLNAFEVVSKVRTDSVLPVHEVQPDAPAELAAIAMRCLERRRERRYQSAREVAEDIGRYQSGARVAAYEYTSWELLRRFVSRNKAATAAALLVLATLLISMAFVWNAYMSEQGVRRDLEKSEAEALGNAEEALTNERRAVDSEKLARKKEEDARSGLAEAFRQKALRAAGEQALDAALAYNALSLANREDPDVRGAVLVGGPLGPPRHRWAASSAAVPETLALSKDGRLLAVAAGTRLVTMWDLTDGKVVTTYESRSGAVHTVQFSPDGGWLAMGGDEGVSLVRTQGAPRTLLLQGTARGIAAVSFSPDGERLVGAGLYSISVWDVNTRVQVATFAGEAHAYREIAVAPDGRSVAVVTDEWEVHRYDLELGKGACLGHLPMPSGTAGATLSADGLHAGALTKDGEVFLMSVDGSTAVRKLPLSQMAKPERLVLLGGGQVVVSDASGKLGLYGVEASSPRVLLTGGKVGVAAAAACLPAHRLVTGEIDGVLRVWDLESGTELAGTGGTGTGIRVEVNVPTVDGRQESGPGEALRRAEAHIAWSPDGALLATSTGGVFVQVWDAATGRERASLRWPGASVGGLLFTGKLKLQLAGTGATCAEIDLHALKARGVDCELHARDAKRPPVPTDVRPFRMDVTSASVQAAVWSPGEEHLATIDGDGLVRCWEMWSWSHAALFGHLGAVHGLSFSPDGQYLASTGKDGKSRVWELGAGFKSPLAATVSRHESWGQRVLFFSDGIRVVSTGWDGTVREVSLAPGKERLVRRTTDPWGVSLALSDARGLVAAGGNEGTIDIWSAGQLEKVASFPGQAGPVADLAFSPEGDVLAGAGWNDRFIRLWSIPTGQFVSDYEGSSLGNWSVALTGDGRRLAAAGRDGKVRVWDYRSGSLRNEIRAGDSESRYVTWSADDSYLVAGSADGLVTLMSGEELDVLVRFRVRDGPIHQLAFSPDSRILAVASASDVVSLIDLGHLDTPGEKLALECLSHFGFYREGTVLRRGQEPSNLDLVLR